MTLPFTKSQVTPEDLASFERDAIADYGLEFHPVPTRYRTNYFAHIFAGGYSSGYYGYIWSEVLDAESVNWFKQHGGLKRSNGQIFADATALSRRKSRLHGACSGLLGPRTLGRTTDEAKRLAELSGLVLESLRQRPNLWN